MKKTLYTFFCLCLLITSISLLWESKRKIEQPSDSKTKVVIKTQTRTVYDTIHISEPICVERKILDTVWFDKEDSSFYYVKEQRIYKDSAYTAWVSGVEPSLDSLEIRTKTEYIEKTTETIIEKTIASKGWYIGTEVSLVDKTIVPQLKASFQTKNTVIGCGIGVFDKKPIYSLDFNLKIK